MAERGGGHGGDVVRAGRHVDQRREYEEADDERGDSEGYPEAQSLDDVNAYDAPGAARASDRGGLSYTHAVRYPPLNAVTGAVTAEAVFPSESTGTRAGCQFDLAGSWRPML